MNDNKIIVAIVALITTAFLLVFSLFQLEIERDECRQLRREAISHGFAEYNRTNAVWQWKTNDVAEVNK